MNFSKIIFVSLLAVTSLSISGMESAQAQAPGIKKSAPSLKFIAANCIRKNGHSFDVSKLPAEIKEYLTELEELIARYKMFHPSENLQENPQQALFNACELGATQIIPDMVALGADVNGVFNTRDGFVTPLMVAAGPFVLKKFGRATTPNLIKTILRNNVELIEILISLGAKIDTVSSYRKQSALNYAVQYENLPAVKTLVNHGACVDGSTLSFRTPLHYTTGINDPLLCRKIMSFLLENQADINSKDINGDTPFIFAVCRRNIEAIKILLRHNADVAITNNVGFTASQMAELLENHDIIELLQQHIAAQKK